MLEKVEYSPKVKLYKFVCEIFKDYLHQYLKGYIVQPGLDLLSTDLIDLEVVGNTCIVEFNSTENAERFVKYSLSEKNPVLYMHKALACEQLPIVGTNSRLCELGENVDRCQPVLSNKVMVQKLPKGYFKFKSCNHAKRFVEAAGENPVTYLDKPLVCKPLPLAASNSREMDTDNHPHTWSRKVIEYFKLSVAKQLKNIGEGIEFTIVSHDRDLCSAVIEFNNAESASLVVSAGLRYDSSHLTLTHMLEKVEFSSKVKLFDFDCQIFSEYLQQYLMGYVVKAGLLGTHIKDMEVLENTCIVEFASSEHAAKFVKYSQSSNNPILYMNEPVKCKHLPMSATNTQEVRAVAEKLPSSKATVLDASYTMHSSLKEPIILEDSWESNAIYDDLQVVCEESGTANDLPSFMDKLRATSTPKHTSEGSNYLPQSDEEDEDEEYEYVDEENKSKDTNHVLAPLRTRKETEIFLTCLKMRMVDGKFKASQKVWREVSEDLRTIHNIEVFAGGCQTRWKSLGDRLRTEKTKAQSVWPHRFDVALLKGTPNIFGKRIASPNVGVISTPLRKKEKLKGSKKPGYNL
ncbi:uncharacterized protein LOC113212741 [Frankliniella occidentalis]|uniref:Uncharacterized protein LOC113212741 n=1 Tax=Frankliniella occidentalis TaxID=133901 RepID=A0A6J1T1B8_FRAOC|nr:uncharacterized protein LOC113212741 [Frankliniella occidentalis]